MSLVTISSIQWARRHKRAFDAVISIEDPGARAARRLRFHNRPAPDHLVLAFEDIDADTGEWQVATADQVERGLAFARTHQGGRLLVHCHAGRCRSTALAFAILADRLGPGREEEAFLRMLDLRPQAVPNRLVTALADTALARDGALLAVLDAWFDRTPAARHHLALKERLLRERPELFARRRDAA